MSNGEDMIQQTKSSNDERNIKMYEWWLANVSRGALSLVQVPGSMKLKVEGEIVDRFSKGLLPVLGVARLIEYYMIKSATRAINNIPDIVKSLYDHINNNCGPSFNLPKGFDNIYDVIDEIELFCNNDKGD